MNLLDLMISIGLQDNATKEIDTVVDGVKNAIDNIQRAANTARNVGAVIAEGFSRATKTVETVTEKVSDIGEAVQETSSSAKLAAHNIETPFTNAVKNVVGQVKTIGSAFEPIANTAKIAINGIGTAFGKISDAAKKAVEKAKSTLEDLASKAKNVAETVGNSLKTAFTVGASAVGVAVGAFTTLTVAATKATGELEQNTGGMLQVFKENAAEMEAIAKTAYTNMGLSASGFMATANQMGALLQGSGFGIAESATLAADVMQRASDVASIMGIDISRAMESIAGAAKGNFTMMDNLGVAINDNTIAQYALSKGIKTSTRDMTTQQKVGLALELFMEKSAYAAGNYAKENQTLAGSFTTAGAAMRNFLSGAGSASAVAASFSNAAKVMAKNLQEIIPRLTEGLQEIAEQLAPEIPVIFETALPAIVEGAKSILTGVAKTLPDLARIVLDSIPTMVSAVGEVGRSLVVAIQEVARTLVVSFSDMLYQFTGIDITPLLQPLQEVAGLIRDAFGSMTEGIDLTSVSEKVNGFIEKLAGAISMVVAAVQGDKFKGFVEDVKGFFDSIKGGLQTILAPVADGIKNLFSQFTNADAGVIQAVADAYGKFAEWFETSLAPVFGSVSESVVKLFGAFTTDLIQPVKEIASAIGKLFDSASGKDTVLRVIADSIVRLFGAFTGTLSNTIGDVAESIRKFADDLAERESDISTFSEWISNLVTWFEELFTAVGDVTASVINLALEIADLDGDWDALWDSMVRAAQDGANLITIAIDGVTTAVSTMVKSVLRSITDLISQTFGEDSWLGQFFDMGDEKATGGGSYSQKYGNKKTAEPETSYASPNVADVPYNASVVGKSAADIANVVMQGAVNGSGAGTGQNQTIVFQIDGAQFARVVLPGLQNAAKQQGLPVRG